MRGPTAGPHDGPENKFTQAECPLMALEQSSSSSSKEPQRRGGGRGSNLTLEDRRRGGLSSARLQERDSQGQFAGAKGRGTSGTGTRRQSEDRREEGGSSTSASSSGRAASRFEGTEEDESEPARHRPPDGMRQGGG